MRRRERRHPRSDRITALCVAAVLHGLLAAFLWRDAFRLAPSEDDEAVISLTFLERPPAVATPAPALRRPPPASRPAPVARRGQPAPAATGTPGLAGPVPNPPGRTSLDLSLPGEYQARAEASPRIMQRPDDPLALRGTRFNPDWTPDGGPIQHTWAFRSRTAQLLLSATGALVKPCTEAERRRREKRCFGEQYEGD